jgi:hypothetical protein
MQLARLDSAPDRALRLTLVEARDLGCVRK